VRASDVRPPDDAAAYFADRHGHIGYTGRHFTAIGGGGDRPAVSDRITAEDLVAVEMLSVQVKPAVAYELLHGELGRTISQLLREIPADVSIFDREARGHLQDGSPADLAWDLLVRQQGVNWVTAGKLLARKRPSLIPVYDRVVKCALNAPKDFWPTLADTLAASAADWAERLATIRDVARVPAAVCDLRIIDVGIWMYHHNDHDNTKKCASIA
jgi:hypothetical protein